MGGGGYSGGTNKYAAGAPPSPPPPLGGAAAVLFLRWAKQLARLSGITVGSVSNLERERTTLPNADTVERLAAAFGLEPEELDPRWLAERVIAQASSLARRQAIKAVLEMSERQVQMALAQL